MLRLALCTAARRSAGVPVRTRGAGTVRLSVTTCSGHSGSGHMLQRCAAPFSSLSASPSLSRSSCIPLPPSFLPAAVFLKPAAALRPAAALPAAALPAAAFAARGLKTIKRQTRQRAPSTYKLKTKKAVSERFLRTGSGRLKYWRRGRRHNAQSQTTKQLRQKRKPRYASGQLERMLNKLLINR